MYTIPLKRALHYSINMNILSFSDALCNKGHAMTLGTRNLIVCDGCMRYKNTSSYWNCAECYVSRSRGFCFNCKPREQQEPGNI